MQRKIMIPEVKEKKVDRCMKILNNKKLGKVLLKLYEEAQKFRKKVD